MLEVSNLVAGYGPVTILRSISLCVGSGEVVAVLGSNGVGKSTLNKVISGLVRPVSGRIVFDGQDISRADPSVIVAAGLSHVPEGRRIFPNISVRENIELGAYRRGHRDRKRQFERVLEIFPRLRERLTQRAGTLSGGEQQMLAIARGLMAQPKLLILDEPSLGLSPLLVQQMFSLVQRVSTEGIAILLVEQNVVQTLDVADRAYVIEQGRIAMEGPAADLRRSPELRRAYLGL